MEDVEQIALGTGLGALGGGVSTRFQNPPSVPAPVRPPDPGNIPSLTGEATDLVTKDAIRRNTLAQLRQYRANPASLKPREAQALADNLVHHVGTPEALEMASAIYQRVPKAEWSNPAGRMMSRTGAPIPDNLASRLRGQVQSSGHPVTLPERDPTQVLSEGLQTRRAGLGSVDEFTSTGVPFTPAGRDVPVVVKPALEAKKGAMFKKETKKGRVQKKPFEAPAKATEIPKVPAKAAAQPVLQDVEPAPAATPVVPAKKTRPKTKKAAEGLTPPVESVSQPMKKLSNPDLMALAKAGDKSAWEELVRRRPPSKSLDSLKEDVFGKVTRGKKAEAVVGPEPTSIANEMALKVGDKFKSKTGREWTVERIDRGSAVLSLKEGDKKLVKQVGFEELSGARPGLWERLKGETGAVGDVEGATARYRQWLADQEGNVRPASNVPEAVEDIRTPTSSAPNWTKSIYMSMNTELKKMGDAGKLIYQKLARADQLENQYNTKWTKQYKDVVSDLQPDEINHVSKVLAGAEVARDDRIRQKALQVQNIFDEIDGEALARGVQGITPSMSRQTDIRRIEGMARFIARLRELGPKGMDGEQIRTLVDQTPDPKRTLELLRRHLGREKKPDPAIESMLRKVRTAMVWTKLANFPIANTLGGQTSIILKSSDKPSIYIDSVRRALSGDAELKALTSESGALMEVTHGMLEELSKINPTKLYGIQATENLNRTIAAGVGRGLAREYFQALRANPGNKLARRRLEELLLEPVDDVLRQGELNHEQIKMAAGRMAELTQGLNVPRNVPHGWSNSHPGVQLALIFRKYAFQGTKAVWEAIKEDKRNIPILLALSQGTGYAIGTAKSTTIGAWKALFDENKDLEESIKEELDTRADYVKRNISFAQDDRVAALLDRTFQSFAFGLPADILQAASSGREGVLSAIVGPALSDVGSIMGGAGEVALGDPKRGVRDLGRTAARALPLPFGGGQAAAKTFFPPQDRSTGRRRRRARRSSR
jgi:hypothetical protein